ncbi:MAG: lactonase family protein [Candidatus Thiodiazotropha sp. (ex Myrtea sp. 'scaly one' KF741663)]|nr:lactonase family protein [Candidatus Thiodiazotropha sp. (ex Myrtea sp. 'scaly one' KF741663)]
MLNPIRLTGPLNTPILTLLSLFLLSLTGCGGGGSGGVTPPPGPAPVPVARFAYVANTGDDTISVFIANNTTGQLIHHGYTLTGDGPTSLTIDPSGLFAYTTNANSTDISLLTIDSLSGELNLADCNLDTGATDNCFTNGTPVSLAFESTGRYAYVANHNIDTISVHAKDPSGALSALGIVQAPIDVTLSGSSGPTQIRVHPDKDVLYVVHDGSSDVGVYDINTSDGTLLEAAGSPIVSGGTGAMDMAITPDGQYAYVANQTSGNLGVFSIDAAGLLVANGSVLPTGGTPHALAMDASGQWLYMISREASGTVSVFEIQTDGTLLQINCSGATQNCPLGNLPESVAIDITGQFISITNSGDNSVNVFTIDQTSGELTDTRTLSARSAPSAVAYLSDLVEATVTPRFAYVANEASIDVSAYLIDASNGALSPIGTPTATAGTPSSVVVDPTGRFAYVANRSTDNISAYRINSGTGALTEFSGSPFDIETNQTGPQSITIDPSGRFAYVAISTDVISAFSIDSSSGALTLLTGSPFVAGDNPGSITVDPTGRFAYATNLISDDVSAYSIDPSTGALSAIGLTVPAGNGPVSIDIDPTGRFAYVANTSFINGGFFVSAFEINASTGALTELTGSPYPAGSGPISVAVDPLGQFVYVANLTSNNVRVYSIDVSTGELTPGSTFSTGVDPQSITIDPTGQFVYVANWSSNDISAYTIDESTGVLSTITGQPFTAGGSRPFSITTTGVVQ